MKIVSKLILITCVAITSPLLRSDTPEDARYINVTDSVSIVKRGKLLLEMPKKGPLFGPSRLIYIVNGKRYYPEGNIHETEQVFATEGFQLKCDPMDKEIFISTMASLFLGFSKAVLSEGYFNIRRSEGSAEDGNSLKRLQHACGNPSFDIKNGEWLVAFFAMNESAFHPVIERHEFSGTITPFRIKKHVVEMIDFIPPIVFKHPLPG
jgi:hypothetical protein